MKSLRDDETFSRLKLIMPSNGKKILIEIHPTVVNKEPSNTQSTDCDRQKCL